MAKKIFDIHSTLVIVAADELLVEIAKNHIACLVKSHTNSQIAAVEIFELDSEQDWEDAFYEMRTQSKILDRSYNLSKVYINMPEAVLIPIHKFNREFAADCLELMHGKNDTSILQTDVLTPEPNVAISYLIPAHVVESINRNMLSVTYSHVYSSLVTQVLSKQNASGNMLVQFYNSKMIVAIAKQGKLQIVQTFAYTTPEDVVYYLLNSCQQFEINAENVELEISGMIDLDSSLYAEVKKYFQHVTIANVPEYLIAANSLDEFPAHYFTPFYNLAL
jgi:prolyl oligopeptidase PreP (S9A serine peptidase family)